MYTLYIDTHNEIITIILIKDNKVISKLEKESSMQHSVYTMPLIDKILKDNNITSSDLNQIVVVNGPGSFTGVRIGVTIAKTMAYLLNIPIKSISTLEEKAICLDGNKKVVVEIEKNGKYIGVFDSNNKLINDYIYLKNSEFDNSEYKDEIQESTLDYEKIMSYLENVQPMNVHAVNPLYIKKIEAMK